MSEELRGQVRDLAHNDAGLPAANNSPAAAALESWCKRGSWDMCRQCASVQPRHLKEAASRDAAKGNIILCKNCAKKEDKQTWIPSPEDVPAVLRGLSSAQIEALRPLDVDSGPEWKAEFGYYFHSSMIRFSWAADDVEDKIDALPSRRERKRAKKARAMFPSSLFRCRIGGRNQFALMRSASAVAGFQFPCGEGQLQLLEMDRKAPALHERQSSGHR